MSRAAVRSTVWPSTAACFLVSCAISHDLPPPTAAGAPCLWSYQCEDLNTTLTGSRSYWFCSASHGYTCQSGCDGLFGALHCADGTPCTSWDSEECFSDDFELVDTCTVCNPDVSQVTLIPMDRGLCP